MWDAFAAHIRSCESCTDESNCPMGNELLRLYEEQADREEAEEERAQELADQGWRGSEPPSWSPQI